MTNTLYDIIRVCEEVYGLQDGNNKLNVEFLERQLNAHPEYNLDKKNLRAKNRFPHLNLMRNKLLLFSYLIGETPIIAGYKEHIEEKRIGSIDDLYLLRPSELGGAMGGDLTGLERSKKIKLRQTDKNLLMLYKLFQCYYSKRGAPWPSWGMVIDELGEDGTVVKYFGQKINYKMVRNCDSPNPLTFGHGGKRAGSGRKKQ